jgi:hypothetical protein
VVAADVDDGDGAGLHAARSAASPEARPMSTSRRARRGGRDGIGATACSDSTGAGYAALAPERRRGPCERRVHRAALRAHRPPLEPLYATGRPTRWRSAA